MLLMMSENIAQNMYSSQEIINYITLNCYYIIIIVLLYYNYYILLLYYNYINLLFLACSTCFKRYFRSSLGAM